MPNTINIFHILGDLSHTASKAILIWAIHSNRSAEGVSLITQALYALLFCSRYLDLFLAKFNSVMSWWNFILKLLYISTSFYIIYLMMRVFARTREREKAWRLGAYSLAGAAILTIPVDLIFKKPFTLMENLWVFSEILESVAVLPQLLLLRQTTVPTVIDSYYLVCLGSYRALYIVNWIIRALKKDPPDGVSVIFGIIQTALYIDFAWVYYTRQRVKLRGGAVVDNDDFSNGWLVKRFVGRKPTVADVEDDFDEEAAPALGGGRSNGHANGNARTKPKTSWGKRGISVQADDGVHDLHADADEDATPLADPASFEDESDGEGDHVSKAVGNGDEWRDAGRS